MTKKNRNIILLWIMLWGGFASGQDVSFSQFYANPLYLNPAFSGSAGVPRATLQYRNQWHSFENAFTTYSAAFDIPVKKIRGGIGLNVLNDAQGNHLLNSLQINLSYSVDIQLSENYKLRGGLQAGYNQNSLQAGKLVFSDNLDPNYGDHGTSQELQNLTDPNYSFVDFSTGVLVYSKRLFFGGAVHHLTEPQQSYYSGQENVSKLPRKYTAHFGARLPVYLYGHYRKKFDISPQLIVQQQGSFQQINYGLFATKRGLTSGVWFRQNFGLRYDAVIFLIGFMKKNWQFMYSYDYTVSGLGGSSGGTSEISLSFFLKKVDKKQILPFYNQYREEFGVE
ncbi:MAG: PorP/SprF family type IX secretion system membrane protein [Draconibacterium sp.]|nr:PorP/SprF family type IX secretion system membrane protein [Draconibacterium sp.]